ncbi:ABC transporter permease [Actinoplanes sp. ATCC 53533]|uniref:ABC transporter permease n=1 Tax=Actinoplanes sp. ATCC 53533 TaxID=1288362 RepID=UPI000F799E04|nr:FtsX-like permease family protein [Actinoplanes sp. ATCC 53533]RSM70886.1 ABC transporter permease [Actinoplanes sp. ATCC 53533]
MSGMVRLTLRTARANLTRSLLSSVAVVLGVAFVCGSLMFTDGLAKTMTGHAVERYHHTDVEVTNEASRDNTLVDRVRTVDGVRAAEATWSLPFMGLAAGDGRKISGAHQAVNVSSDPALRPFGASQGRMPSARGEVVLDEHTAGQENLRVGDQLLISGFGSAAKTYTLVGLTTATDTFAEDGALIVMTTADISAVAGYPSYTVIVDAAAGVSNAELAARVATAVGGQALPHDELVRRATDAAVGDAATFRNALLGFGVLAVCMAAFVIANTFTIVLAQRTKETALLRLVGATRRQVFRAVVLEAAVIGLGGSVLGLAVGVLLAYGLPVTLSAVGATAEVSPVISAKAVLAALAVGVGVTVLSALLPARRGTRVLPVEALSDAAVQVARPAGRARRIWGIVVTATGLAGLAGATAVRKTEIVFAGTLLVVTGFLLLSPIVVPLLVRLVRRPAAAVGGATASLALLNAVRNPRRFATTTNALVIGVTLVGTFTLIARSAEAPAEQRADEKMVATFLISSDLGVLPADLLDAMGKRPELAPARPNYQAFDQKSGLDVRTGTTREGTAVVSADTGAVPGGSIKIGGRSFEVASVAAGTQTVWLAPADITAVIDGPFLADVQVDPAPGVTKSDARTALDAALASFPSAVSYDHDDYTEHLNAKLNRGLDVVTALLALAVIIALIGVANTLTLSVVERTRENALLRAIGLTRRQLRLILATEALVMALTGTLIGVAVSVAVALSALGSIEMHGHGASLVMPWDRLGVLLAVAVLAALAASIAPARRAIRLPIAENLAAEG